MALVAVPGSDSMAAKRRRRHSRLEEIFEVRAGGQGSRLARLGPDVIREVASFLPAAGQFGSLRAVSRDFYGALPASPSPEPLFSVVLYVFGVAGRGLEMPTVQLGTHRISHIRWLLNRIENGEQLMPTTGDYNSTRLHFRYVDVDSVPPFNIREWTWRPAPQPSRPDLEVGMRFARQGPPFNIPQIFADMTLFATTPTQHRFGDVSVDQILRGLWLVYDKYVALQRQSEALLARQQAANASVVVVVPA